MGRYTRKSKMTADVAVVDVSQSHLGVRTRAKTLALAAAGKSDACYLELRSRRLEKTTRQRNSRIVRDSCGCVGKEERGIRIGGEGFGIEASFGENNLGSEARARGTRESTPCSLIRSADNITTPPGSTTKKHTYSSASIQGDQNAILVNVPSARELEEFFALEELPMHHHFIEKYNFDFVKDVPLPGRYEWVAVRP